VVWVVNNNQWAYSTPNQLEVPVPTIAQRADAYGMPGKRVDGAEVLEVHAAVSEACERARRGEGPSLIESVSLRWRGHAGHDAAKYVPKEMLEDYMQNKDPVKRLQERLLADGIVDDAVMEEIQQRIEDEFTKGYEFAQSSPFPTPEDVTRGVFSDDGYWRSEPSREGGTG
jgi:TPP-dependent pyruvate/acetoin dehydrogenase alpha subunit